MRRCHAHVQAIIVAIDQYAEAALGNRYYFLNRPYGIGGKRDCIPRSAAAWELMPLEGPTL
jgi:hypothetical protein